MLLKADERNAGLIVALIGQEDISAPRITGQI